MFNLLTYLINENTAFYAVKIIGKNKLHTFESIDFMNGLILCFTLSTDNLY